MQSSRNTYIGDEGTRGVSGGERRRVSIGVDIIHGPALLFLDEPTSGLDSTSAHSVIERVHHIARSGSTVILTIHQPSYRIQMLLDHMVILARGQLMFIGSPKDVGSHLGRMGRKVPKGENSIEHLLDVIQEYDQSELGVGALADFCLTGLKPPRVSNEDHSDSTAAAPTPHRDFGKSVDGSKTNHGVDAFDRSLRSPWNSSRSPWSGSQSGVMDVLRFTPNRHGRGQRKAQNLPRLVYMSIAIVRIFHFNSKELTHDILLMQLIAGLLHIPERDTVEHADTSQQRLHCQRGRLPDTKHTERRRCRQPPPPGLRPKIRQLLPDRNLGPHAPQLHQHPANP